MSKLQSSNSNSTVVGFYGTFVVIVVLKLCGCQSLSTVGKLPDSISAPPTYSNTQISLGRFARADLQIDRIQSGDTLEISILSGFEKSAQHPIKLRVTEGGTLSLPIVGEVYVAKLNEAEATNRIRETCVQRDVFRNPTVTVSIVARRTNRVTVLGAVEKPGEYELPVSNSNLVAALIAAGGLDPQADSIVEIRQPPDETRLIQQVAHSTISEVTEPRKLTIDLLASAPAQALSTLQTGAVIEVRRKPSRSIQVIGLVNRPNRYQLPSNEDIRVLDAIAMAGGLKQTWANKVFVIRQLPESDDVTVIKVTVANAKQDNNANIRLAHGDVISVEETLLTVVQGGIRRIFNFGVSARYALPIF